MFDKYAGNPIQTFQHESYLQFVNLIKRLIHQELFSPWIIFNEIVGTE